MKKLALVPILAFTLAACADPPGLIAPEGIHTNQKTTGHTVATLEGRFTQSSGINDAGVVVGRTSTGGTDPWRARIWDGGSDITLDIPDSRFVGINNHGAALGLRTGNRTRGFVYRSGILVDITGEHRDEHVGEVFFTGSLDGDHVIPMDISDGGVVVARAVFFPGDGSGYRYGFVWQEGSEIVYIRGGVPTAINNHGTIIGFAWHGHDPVVWEAGSYDEPRVVPGIQDHFVGHEIELKAINDAGQILGIACRRDDGRRLCDGAAYDRRGFVVVGEEVAELPLPRRSMELHDLGAINGRGLAVGTVLKPEKGTYHEVPVLWTVASAEVRVQELPRGEYTRALATAISGNNQVAGHANPWEALLWTLEDSGDPPPPPGDGPTASFTHGCGNSSTCEFTDTSTGSSLSAWRWDFGDGSAGSEAQDPAHQYTAQGTYTVTLTVTDESGLSDATQATIDCRRNPRHGLRCS